MTNCQAGNGEFLRWKRTETDFLVHELGDIILKCGLYCDCAVISRKDWDELVTGDLLTALGDAEGYSLRMAFVRASKWARQTGGDDKIAFVFDRRQEREQEGNRIYALFKHLSEIEPTAVTPISIEFSDSAHVLPLQAADLVAWEYYHHAREYLRTGKPYASRKQLRRLWNGGRMKIGLATRSAIEEMVALEVGKEEKIGRAAELMTIDNQEFASRVSAPLESEDARQLDEA
ncbi:MAG: DUF3800 domain-containing protein [Xanthobacteraceae bacterium]